MAPGRLRYESVASVNEEFGGGFTGDGPPAGKPAVNRAADAPGGTDAAGQGYGAPFRATAGEPAKAQQRRVPGPVTAAGREPDPPAGGDAPPGPARQPPASRAVSVTADAQTFPPSGEDVFARYTRTYAAERPGQQLAVLHAGAVTATSDLGIGRLRASGTQVSVSLVDDDQPVTKAAAATCDRLRRCTLGDLRTVPLAPRAFDIVQCALLLGRIRHAELILDRLVAAIKPGGLLLLRIRDRDSAAGFLDRVLPRVARRAIERARHPGMPGPHPAVYERLSSARGVHAYALLRGLAVAERRALGAAAGGLPHGPRGYLAAQKLIAVLSRGRLTDAHEELLYVLRKPENRFARVL